MCCAHFHPSECAVKRFLSAVTIQNSPRRIAHTQRHPESLSVAVGLSESLHIAEPTDGWLPEDGATKVRYSKSVGCCWALRSAVYFEWLISVTDFHPFQCFHTEFVFVLLRKPRSIRRWKLPWIVKHYLAQMECDANEMIVWVVCACLSYLLSSCICCDFLIRCQNRNLIWIESKLNWKMYIYWKKFHSTFTYFCWFFMFFMCCMLMWLQERRKKLWWKLFLIAPQIFFFAFFSNSHSTNEEIF